MDGKEVFTKTEVSGGPDFQDATLTFGHGGRIPRYGRVADMAIHSRPVPAAEVQRNYQAIAAGLAGPDWLGRA